MYIILVREYTGYVRTTGFVGCGHHRLVCEQIALLQGAQKRTYLQTDDVAPWGLLALVISAIFLPEARRFDSTALNQRRKPTSPIISEMAAATGPHLICEP